MARGVVPLWHDELWLVRLSWLCARAAAMATHEANVATIDAAVRIAEQRIAA